MNLLNILAWGITNDTLSLINTLMLYVGLPLIAIIMGVTMFFALKQSLKVSDERDVLETEINNIKSIDDWLTAKENVDKFIKKNYKVPVVIYLHKSLVNKSVELLKNK